MPNSHAARKEKPCVHCHALLNMCQYHSTCTRNFYMYNIIAPIILLNMLSGVQCKNRISNIMERKEMVLISEKRESPENQPTVACF